MNIRIEKGGMKYLKDCEEALKISELGKHYFEREDSARNAVLEAIDSGNMYVALENEQCIGFLYYLPKGAFHSFPYLHLLVIKQEHRSKGVGKILMGFLEELVFKTRDKIFLVVADFNPRAKLFYEKLGYKQIGTIPSLYREGIDEYLMMKVNRQKS
jgi:ribosomal protein S18 acetylase RimI-like enzyme